MNSLLSWLTPARRKAIHSLVAGIGFLIVTMGLATDAVVQPWLAVVYAALAAGSLVLSSWAAKNVDYKRIYGAAAVLIAAVTGTGIITSDIAVKLDGVVQQIVFLIPVLVALVRTDTSTPTGEPQGEYEARHAA